MQVRIQLYEFNQFQEREWAQSIICIVGHVAHVNIHRVVKDRPEELAAMDAGQEAAQATWILFGIDGVRVQAAGLSGQNLDVAGSVVSCELIVLVVVVVVVVRVICEARAVR